MIKVFAVPLELFLIILISACIIVGLGIYLHVLSSYHSKDIPCKLIHLEYFKIPVETDEKVVELEAKIIKSVYTPENLAPCVIMCHGWRSEMNGSRYLQEPLALNGYAFVTYSSRGHGKSGGKREFPAIHEDIINVIDFLEKNSAHFGIDINRIAVIGHSMGANTALMKPYLDSRVKIVIGISGAHDIRESYIEKGITTRIFWIKTFLRGSGLKFNASPEFNRIVSPKYYLEQPANTQVFLIHAKNDTLVEFDNFEKNVALLHLPADHTLVFEKGGHSLYRLECMVLTQIIKWLNQSL